MWSIKSRCSQVLVPDGRVTAWRADLNSSHQCQSRHSRTAWSLGHGRRLVPARAGSAAPPQCLPSLAGQSRSLCENIHKSVTAKEKEVAFLEQAVTVLRGGLRQVLPDQLTVHKAALEFVTPEKGKFRESRNLDDFSSSVSSALQAAFISRCLSSFTQ